MSDAQPEPTPQDDPLRDFDDPLDHIEPDAEAPASNPEEVDEAWDRTDPAEGEAPSG